MRCDICGSKECCGAELGPQIDCLEAQRDRLREALLAVTNGPGAHDRGYIITHATMQAARAALAEGGQDD